MRPQVLALSFLIIVPNMAAAQVVCPTQLTPTFSEAARNDWPGLTATFQGEFQANLDFHLGAYGFSPVAPFTIVKNPSPPNSVGVGATNIVFSWTDDSATPSSTEFHQIDGLHQPQYKPFAMNGGLPALLFDGNDYLDCGAIVEPLDPCVLPEPCGIVVPTSGSGYTKVVVFDLAENPNTEKP